MNIKQIITVGVAGMAMGAMALDNVEVTDVKVRQRYPWNGKVDIDFTLDSKPTEPYQMQVEVYDNVGKTNLPVKSVCTEGVSVEANPCMVRTDTRRIVWDAAKDLPNGFKCTNVLVTCRDARLIPVDKLYCVINLSDGSKEYLSGVPAGGWTDEYKTTKMVFRRIEAGSFMMGSPSGETGRQSNETHHQVTITKPFYIAIYELTQCQHAKIMGGESSSTSPVLMRFGDVRGHDFGVVAYLSGGGGYYCDSFYETQFNYPKSTAVDSTSLVGLLRMKTGLMTIDLPTEAQWEYSAKSLSVTALSDGNSISGKSVNYVGRYNGNRTDGKGDAGSETITLVGCYQPNAWGLYDMHGNAREWCLDAWKDDLGVESVTDPIGNASLTIIQSGTYRYSTVRVVKGGGYYQWHSAGIQSVRSTTGGVSDSSASAETCRSSYRGCGYSSSVSDPSRDGVAYYTYEGVRLVFSAE